MNSEKGEGMMILPMLARMQATTQLNNANFGMMQAQDAQLGLINSMNFNSVDTFSRSELGAVHRAEQQNMFSQLLNETKAKIAEAQLKALNKKKES